MATDDDPGAGAAPAAPQGFLSERTKWLIEKCALPFALMAGPLIFQGMALYLANADRAATEIRDKQEQKATREREQAEQKATQQREQTDQKFQLYINLLSKREEGETGMRLGLFNSLIGNYMERGAKEPGKKLTQLELLSLNFHDSLNLNPLFWDLQRQVDELPKGPRRAAIQEQLDRVAKEVKDRQVALLEVGAVTTKMDADLRLVDDDSDAQPVKVPWRSGFEVSRFNEAGRPEPQKCEFTVQVAKKDPQRRRVWVDLKSTTCDHRPVGFWVDMFDFPLATFTRISPFERIAVVLDEYNERFQVARLTVLYFPSTRSAAKDKPYIEDLVTRLRTPDAAPSAPRR